jgi:SAM-dependent methyltransferase
MEFYANEYDSFYRPEIYKKRTTREEVNPIIDRLTSYNLFPHEINNVLDIGSGEGRNLSALQNEFNGASFFAIEPSKQSQSLLEKAGYKLVSSDVDSDWDQANETKYDIVIMRHVLEHFLDPLNILTKVRNVLADGGILYIAVPNCLKPTSNLELSWFRIVHTYYFNKFTLENLVQKAGFKIDKIIDGDSHNKGELVVVVSAANKPIAPQIKSEHFKIQRDFFVDRLKEEKSFKFKIKKLTSGFKRKLGIQ